MNEPRWRVYEFGAFHLNASKRELLRGKTPVKLYPKQFDILLALVERAGSLVSKDELIRIVWPDSVVEEGNLSAHIWHLRRILGDGAGHRGHIVTVPGRGYQFVASVREVLPDVATNARFFRPVLVAGVLLLIVSLVAAVAFLSRSRTHPAVGYEQLTFRRGIVWSARFAPDGRTIVYGASWDGHSSELFLARAGSPESQSLVTGDADVLSIAPSGEMAISMRRRFRNAWESTGTLARLPLAGGAARDMRANIKDADWAPDGRSLVIVRAIGQRERLEFPEGNVAYESDGFIIAPRVARTGERVAFLERAGGRESVVVVGGAGKKWFVPVGQNAATGLAWSAAGDELIYTLVKNGSTTVHAVAPHRQPRVITQMAGEWRLHDISREGRAILSKDHKRARVMAGTVGESRERDLSWFDRSVAADVSRDGRLVLLTEIGAAAGETRAVYIRRLDGAPAVRLGEGQARALSPDGRWVIAVQGSAPERLALLPTGVGQPRRLNNGRIIDYYGVKWFPDGERILFGAIEPGRRRRRYVQRVSDGEPQEVQWTGTAQHSLFLPDGKSYISVSNQRGYLSSVEGGEARPVPGWVQGEVPLQVSDDGRWVFLFDPRSLYTQQPDAARSLDRLDVRTGARERWLTLPIPDAMGIMHPGPEFDPVLIAANGRTYVYNYMHVLSDLFLVDGLR